MSLLRRALVPGMLVLALACAPQPDPAADADADAVAAPTPDDGAAADTARTTDETLADPIPPPAPDTPATVRATTHTGRIVISGTADAPMTMLSIDDGSYLLTGRFEAELRQLSGALVRVDGTPASADARPRFVPFNVTRYEILEIDGERPVVGTLAVRDGVWWIDGTRTLRLSTVPEPLRVHDGALVWIVGDEADGTLDVRFFGVIRTR
jgi:hypothetical protein